MRRNRGVSLLELMVAGLLFGLILTLLAQTMGLVRTAFASRDSRLEAARASRDLLLRLSLDLRQAAWVYAGYTGTVDGHAYLATDLLFAVPDSVTTWRMVGVYNAPMVPPDSRNPAAQDVIYYERGLVGSLVLTGLTQGRRRSYRCYLVPGTLRAAVQADRSVSLEFWTARLPERGASLLERRSLLSWPRLAQ